jgi:hypothetical protein
MNNSEKTTLLKTLKDYDLTMLCLTKADPNTTKIALAKLKAMLAKSQDAIIVFAKK